MLNLVILIILNQLSYDELSILTSIEKKSKVQIPLIQKIFRKKTLIIEAKIKVAIINIEGKVTRMPESLFKIF